MEEHPRTLMKTLDELAMEHAIASIDPEIIIGLRGLVIPTSPAESIRQDMLERFSPYETQEAIKRAKEIVKMVIPDQGDH